MSDEITQPPAVTEDASAIEVMPDADLQRSMEMPDWNHLTIDQKIDILHRKVDSIGQQVAWIGQTFQGLISMVGNVGPMDIFKMMRGGK